MKILKINDVAGGACIQAKYLRKLGHECTVINAIPSAHGIVSFYGDIQTIPLVVFGYIKRHAHEYDIINVHHSYTWLQAIKKLTDKPIVINYHGTEIATMPEACQMFDKFTAKKVLVNGEQLLQYHPRAEYLPNAPDTDHFTPGKKGSGLLTFDMPYIDISKITMGEPYEVAERDYLYHELPSLLRKYEGYIDVKYHTMRGWLIGLSKTGMEALACGLRVYHNGEWLTELPARNHPESAAKELIGHYEEVLRK